MKCLQAVAQHRSVGFVEDRWRDVDDEIRIDADEVAVERRVVELAESEAVRHDGFTAR